MKDKPYSSIAENRANNNDARFLIKNLTVKQPTEWEKTTKNTTKTIKLEAVKIGLTMKEKKALTREIARRYRRGSKKEKHMMLDEFTRTTGYNRKYAIHLLTNWGKKRTLMVDGKPKRRKKRIGRVIYGEPNIMLLLHDPELSIDTTIKEKFLTISPATTDPYPYLL